MSIWSEYDFRKIPFDQVERVGQRTLLYRDLFCVSWLLGRYCNYKCSYCWPYARSDEKDHRPTELVIGTLDEIKRQARERGFNSFHFSFSGGEPTLHPGYLKILEHYANDLENVNYQSCHMTSNISPGIGWFKKYVEVTKNLHRVSITASYHREFAQKEKFADKLVFLQENDVHVTINSVMVPDRFEATWEDMLYFHERGINVTLKPQSNTTATKVVDGYTEDMLQKLRNGMPQRNYTAARLKKKNETSQRPAPLLNKLPKDIETNEPIPPHLQVELTDKEGKPWYMDQAERFNAFEFNRFKDWECSAGYRSIIIREPDGHIKRSYSCHDEPLGHIETGFKLFDKPAPCMTQSCVSSADSKIPKKKRAHLFPSGLGTKAFERAVYKYQDIKTVHLEITTKCNARCPMCLRTVCGGKTNPQLPLVELSLEDIKTIFPPQFIKQLNRMFICGNYGDPIAAKETLEVYRYFREQNPDIRLDMFTNGSARPASWWEELAKTINLVHFSIDGLEDTNHLYRKGTNFQTILNSVRAYIGSGGEAVWDYIVFKHNEHQIEKAQKLAKELGFKKINIKKTGRFFSNTKMQAKDKQVVYDRQGEVEYYLEMPIQEKYQNQALAKEQMLVEKYGSLESYLDKTPIECKVDKEKSLYMSAVGHAFPCCWTGNQLYPWYFPEGKSYMWKIVNGLENGIDDLNAKNKSLESIVNGPFFQKVLPESWSRASIKEGRPKCCAKTCGKEFDPFKAQFS